MISMDSALVFVVLIAVVIFIGSYAKILREYERGVIFRLGRTARAILNPGGGGNGPGLVVLVPFIDRMVRVSLQTVALDVPPQDVISRDNVSLKVSAVIYFRVVDPVRAVIAVQGNGRQSRRNSAVIGGSSGESLLGQLPAGAQAQLTARLGQLAGNGLVIVRRGHDGYVAKILGGRAHHGRPTNINVFDDLVKMNARLGRGLLEGVKVHHHHIYWLDSVFFGCGNVGRIAPHMQNAAMHPGMQGLYPPIHHFRESGEI